ncbi:hypothetical protein B0H14DRAFT_2582820 [Mycena olivaceomarginata]|nr:hypothetical protein B0H14DRAFT_2582820 [Mycena olivaceomarginata]
MDTCEAVKDSVKIRLYCAMLIDAVPIEGVEREIGPELRCLCAVILKQKLLPVRRLPKLPCLQFPDLNDGGRHRILRYKFNQDPMESGGRFGPCPLDNTVPEVDEVEYAVDIGLGRSSAVAENDAVGVRRGPIERGIVLDTGRRGGGQVGNGSSVEIGSSTGGTDAVTVLKYEWEKVDVDVETDVEGPGAEEGDGWSNFLCFARMRGVIFERAAGTYCTAEALVSPRT